MVRKLGPYTLEQKLGQGGFGVVFRARKTDGQHYAIKCASSRRAVRTLRQEMDLALKISGHENLVRVHTFLHNKKRTRIYCVMEFCDEGDLNHFVVTKKPDLSLKFSFMLDIARGLAHLHSHNIMHRDIKPENVLIATTPTGYRCKITDFGISKEQQDSDVYFYTVVGSTSYMSPEVLSSKKYTYSADIFSLGLLYYAIYRSSAVSRRKGKLLVAVQGGELINTLVLKRELDKSRFMTNRFQGHEQFGLLLWNMFDGRPDRRPEIGQVTTVVHEFSEKYKIHVVQEAQHDPVKKKPVTGLGQLMKQLLTTLGIKSCTEPDTVDGELHEQHEEDHEDEPLEVICGDAEGWLVEEF